MQKKFLIALGVLLILGVISVIVGGDDENHVKDKIAAGFEQREPEFRQYVTMTPEEQNNYVAKNVDDLHVQRLALFGAKDPKMEEIQPFVKELEKNPEFMQAKISWGRSLVAMTILDFEDITKNLSPETLKQLQSEVDEYEVRRAEYRKLIDLYKPNEK